MLKHLVLLMCLVVTSACIKTADQVSREKRLENINEQVKDSQGLMAELISNIKDMRTQLDNMNGRLEEMENAQNQVKPEDIKKMQENVAFMKTQQEAQGNHVIQIQNELKEQRGFIEKVTANISALKAAPAPQKKSAKEALASGLKNIVDDKYAAARSDLEPLIDHKDLTAGDNNKVLHGLGKVEYYTGNNEKALVYFSKVFSKYPKSSLAPSSLLFIGRSLKKMGKKDDANEAFSKVVEDYSGTPEAKHAQKEL